MALNQPLTTELIHQTADQLQADGIRPTLANVRERLGGGSYTTIGESMKSWKAEKETTAQLEKVVIPSTLAERLQIVGAELWETAQSHANDQLAKERETLEHKHALMLAEVEEYKNIVATLESEQGELLAQLDQLNNTVATMQSDLSTATEQNRQLTEQGNLLQAQLTTATDSNRQLTEKIDEQAIIIGKQTNTITDLKTANATLETQKNNFIERLEQSESQVKKANEYGERNMKDLADLSAQYANIQGQNKTLGDQLTKAEALTQSQADKIEKLTADLATAKATGATAEPKAPATKKPAKKVTALNNEGMK